MIQTIQYIRKPVIVDAIQVTEENFDELVPWCGGTIHQTSSDSQKFIRVDVHTPKNARQTKAFVSDWILCTDTGFKIYTDKAFKETFNVYTPITISKD
jgi:hypothetical protein